MAGGKRAALQRQQQRLERSVRATSLRARGAPDPSHSVVNIPQLLDQLGTAQLIEIIDLDGVLHVLSGRAGRVRHFIAGRTEDAIRAADFARFALRRLARSRPGDNLGSALGILKAVGPQLQDALLGPAAGELGDRSSVSCRPASCTRFHGH
jgi:hypothetical protein